jgi:putative lysine transport system substrate-binding protein
MRKILLTFVLGIFTFVLVGCSEKEYVDPLADGVLTVGMECAYAPYNWTTATKTETSVLIAGTNSYCDGYDVKVAQELANDLGVTLEVKAIEWDGLIESLRTNGIDAIIAGMSPTEERKQTIAFTDVYYRSEQVIVVRGNSDLAFATTLNDFEDAKISAQLGTLQEGLISQLVGAVTATSLQDYPTLVTALSSGTIDGFIAELPVATQITSSNTDLSIVRLTDGFVLDEEKVTTAIGIRKADTDLQSKLNDALASITTEQRTTWMNSFIELSSAE